jgi:hypothetical protein
MSKVNEACHQKQGRIDCKAGKTLRLGKIATSDLLTFYKALYQYIFTHHLIATNTTKIQ